LAEEHGLDEDPPDRQPAAALRPRNQPLRPPTGPSHGLDGYIQWRYDNGFAEMQEPILSELKQIQNRDAILYTNMPVGETIGVNTAMESSWPRS